MEKRGSDSWKYPNKKHGGKKVRNKKKVTRKEWARWNRPNAEEAKDVRYDFWQRHFEKRQRKQEREKKWTERCVT